MRVSDFLLERLADEGIDTVFLVYGAACGEIVDAMTRQSRIRHVCPMHEQAAGFAAEGYAKVKGVPGCAMSTSGPGAHNLVTAIGNCYYDSVPVIFITGQINTQFMRPHPSIRQLGFQETPIVDIVRPITKYAVTLLRGGFKWEINHAINICRSGRPVPSSSTSRLMSSARSFLDDLKRAERPVVLVGGGAYRSRVALRDLLGKFWLPCVSTWNGLDVITADSPFYCGRVGTYGGPGRNFAIQNADLLLILGCRLSGRITGGMPQTFARGAKKYWVELDEHLLNPRWQPVKTQVNVEADCREFIAELLEGDTFTDHSKWLAQCVHWCKTYDPVRPEMLTGDFHHYGFMRKLSHLIPDNAIVVSDTGGNVIMMGHAFETKWGQRVFTSNGSTPMGFALCGALGAWFADPTRPIFCIIGDGGMMMNLQELQTIKNYGAQIKIFIINNHIYGNTVSYQKINYGGRLIACGPDGYKPADFLRLASAFDIPNMYLEDFEEVPHVFDWAMRHDQCLVDVLHDGFCTYEPRISRFDLPIEDMYPFLPRDEFRANMFIEPMPGWEDVK